MEGSIVRVSGAASLNISSGVYDEGVIALASVDGGTRTGEISDISALDGRCALASLDISSCVCDEDIIALVSVEGAREMLDISALGGRCALASLDISSCVCDEDVIALVSGGDDIAVVEDVFALGLIGDVFVSRQVLDAIALECSGSESYTLRMIGTNFIC
jgi:hypothetical protein